MKDLRLWSMPMRRVVVRCRPEQPFAMPLGETLGPYRCWRGLLGAALTHRSADLGRALFKPEAVRDPLSNRALETAVTPWRLRLGHLYAREVAGDFDLIADLFGEEPCARADEFAEAVRLAGSGELFVHYRTGRHARWGLRFQEHGRTGSRPVGFAVEDIDLGSPVEFGAAVQAVGQSWQRARGALLTLRTLTVLSERRDTHERGRSLATIGDLDAGALAGNVLRRLAVLDVATRRSSRERSSLELERSLAGRDHYMAALLAEAPLGAVDVVMTPLQEMSPKPPHLQGLIGSARFIGADILPWLPGFIAAEWLGLGESTAFGAGQVCWTPLAGFPAQRPSQSAVRDARRVMEKV